MAWAARQHGREAGWGCEVHTVGGRRRHADGVRRCAGRQLLVGLQLTHCSIYPEPRRFALMSQRMISCRMVIHFTVVSRKACGSGVHVFM